MAATTSLLGLVTPTQGTLSGTWGDTVNYGISDYVDISVAGTLTLTNDGAVTLANTTGSSSGNSITSSLTGAGTVTAQFAIVRVTGTLTTAKVVTGPSYSKTYTVVNAATGSTVTFKASGQTGVSIAVGESAFVYFNGTDYVKIVGTATAGAAGGSTTQVQFNSSGILSGSANLTWDGTTLSSTQINITGQGTLRLQDTTGGEYVGLRSPSALGASYTLTFPADDGTSGQALITDGSGVLSWSTAASGDVYGPASATANGIALFDGTTGKLLKDSAATDGLIYGLTVGRGAGAVSTNTAVGVQAAAANTTGSQSAYVGWRSGYSNTTGDNNAAFGDVSLYANTTGSANTAIGRASLASNTTGANSTAVGYLALNANTTASNNTAVGYQASYSNATAPELVAIGYQAAFNATGGYSTSLGHRAGYGQTSGDSNTYIGRGVASINTATGSHNSALGNFALARVTSGLYNVAVGSAALESNTTASNNTAVGYQSLYANTTGNSNVAVGYQAADANISSNSITAIGFNAFGAATAADAGVAVGKDAGGGGNVTGTFNTFVGCESGYSATSGGQNVAIGGAALRANTTASQSTAIGYQAGYTNTTGANLVAIGYQAGYTSNASNNTFVGYYAGQTTTGTLNTFVGVNGVGYLVSSGAKNTIIGGFSGNQGSLDIRTASNNIVLSDGDGNPRGIFDGSGNFMVGATSTGARLRVVSTASQSQGSYITHPTATQDVISCENSATSGDNVFIQFYTDATVSRGSIAYNRAGGLVVYNTTSDYRAKDISGPVTDSGALIDSVPVYMGKMKGATQERPMFIAHETPTYAHMGVKDAVDADGNPVYQQMDASALIPVMWAEIQSLRKRLADAGL